MPTWMKVAGGVTFAFALGKWHSNHFRNNSKLNPKYSEKDSSSYAIGYILTGDSLKMFKRLRNEKDRSEFINSFWKELDPYPFDSKNELREEFEKRISYANKKFILERKRGWRTDRGRVYIMYGPPDEIKRMIFTNVSFRQNPDAEMWLYNISGERSDIPNELIQLSGHKKFFLFSNLSGDASIRQVYSSEFGEYYEPNLF